MPSTADKFLDEFQPEYTRMCEGYHDEEKKKSFATWAVGYRSTVKNHTGVDIGRLRNPYVPLVWFCFVGAVCTAYHELSKNLGRPNFIIDEEDEEETEEETEACVSTSVHADSKRKRTD